MKFRQKFWFLLIILLVLALMQTAGSQKGKGKKQSKPNKAPKKDKSRELKSKPKKKLDKRDNGASDSSKTSCEALRTETSDVWLLGETMIGSPFAAQLLAVYSYLPVAFVFQSDLVVTDLWIHDYKIVDGEIKGSYIGTRSFSSFFDYNRFVTYWSRHHKKIISSKVYQNCFRIYNDSNDPLIKYLAAGKNTRQKKKLMNEKRYLELSSRYLHNLTVLRRIPEFYPYDRHDFKNFFYFSNLTTVPHFKFPFHSHQQIRIDSRYKMTGLYSFWNDTTMLSYAYSAIQPAIPIEKVAHAMIEILPKPLITIHVRIDLEAFYELWIKLLPGEDLYKKLISMIITSPCLSDYVKIHHNTTNNETEYEIIKQPILYITMNFQPDLHGAQKRKQQIIQSFLNIGFYGIYNNDRMYYLYLEQQQNMKDGKHPEKNDVNDHITTLSLMQTLSPEQLSYVDMIVSRSSSCFIPSPIPSLHSYLVTRMRSLDKNVFEKYEDINVTSYGSMYFYRDWGL